MAVEGRRWKLTKCSLLLTRCSLSRRPRPVPGHITVRLPLRRLEERRLSNENLKLLLDVNHPIGEAHMRHGDPKGLALAEACPGAQDDQRPVPGRHGVEERLDLLGGHKLHPGLDHRGEVDVEARALGDHAVLHRSGEDVRDVAVHALHASWLGWLVRRDQAIVFVVDDDQDRVDLVSQCLTIGYEHLAGELAGGLDAWAADRQPVGVIPLVSPAALDRQLVLDVRQTVEYADGHVPGAVHLELGSLTPRLDAVPTGPITLMCGHGERAMTGASILAAAGRDDVSVMVGGPDDWARAAGTSLAS